MTLRTEKLFIKYNDRIKFLLAKTAKEEVIAKEIVVVSAAGQLYRAILDNMDNGFEITYARWISWVEEFLKDPKVLALDPDNYLLNVANKIMRCPELLKYYNTYFKYKLGSDVSQLREYVGRVERFVNRV